MQRIIYNAFLFWQIDWSHFPENGNGPDGPDGPDGLDGPDAPDAPDGPDGPDGPDAPDAPDAPASMKLDLCEGKDGETSKM